MNHTDVVEAERGAGGREDVPFMEYRPHPEKTTGPLITLMAM